MTNTLGCAVAVKRFSESDFHFTYFSWNRLWITRYTYLSCICVETVHNQCLTALRKEKSRHTTIVKMNCFQIIQSSFAYLGISRNQSRLNKKSAIAIFTLIFAIILNIFSGTNDNYLYGYCIIRNIQLQFRCWKRKFILKYFIILMNYTLKVSKCKFKNVQCLMEKTRFTSAIVVPVVAAAAIFNVTLF